MASIRKRATTAPRPVLGLAAGLAAGLVAAAVMELFQSQTAEAFGVEGDPADSATAKTANAVVEVATDAPLPREDRPGAGRLVHYAVGAALGGAYGLVAEYRPGVASGFGSGYGLVTSALLDEGTVPALGLGEAPAETPLGTHLYGAAAHLVFGVVLEGTRALLGGRR
ncbi:DUF1440 domain-containing protein [Sphingomonas sp. RS2018]